MPDEPQRPVEIGLVGKRGRLTAKAAAEAVALDVLLALPADATVDGRFVRAHIDALLRRAADEHDDDLAAAAAKAQPMHVLKVCQAWVGGLAKTRRRARA